MLLNAFRSRGSCELEARFVQNRIQSTEKSLSELCTCFSKYSRNAGRINDKTRELSRSVFNYSEAENDLNASLSTGLEYLAEFLSMLSKYGDKRVECLDSKVVLGLARYKDLCKQAKEEVKEIYTAREKEVNRKRQLDKIKERNPRNRQQIIQAESELVKATAKVTKSVHNLEEKTTNFERDKLRDVKSTLLDFIAIEVAYHVNSLETLTKAYDEIEAINEESDLERFNKSLRPLDSKYEEPSRKPSLFKSGGRFGSLGALFSTNSTRRDLRKANGKLSKSEEALQAKRDSSGEDEEEVEESETSSSEEEESRIKRRN